MLPDNYAASPYAAVAAAANLRAAFHSHTQYPSMNFPNPLARDFISFGNNSHSFKHGPPNTCPNQIRGNINSAIAGNNHLNSNMMFSLTPNNYYHNFNLTSSAMVGANNHHHNNQNHNHNHNHNLQAGVPPPTAPTIATNHGSTSRSSSVASNHAIQHGSESSSCSYGYNSPSTIPHSPYQKRSSVSATSSVVSSQNSSTVPASVPSGVSGYPNNTFNNPG